MAKYEIPCRSFAGNNKRNDVDEKQNSSQSNELVQIRAGQTDQPVRIIIHVHRQSQPIVYACMCTSDSVSKKWLRHLLPFPEYEVECHANGCEHNACHS